jgi:hypothetical protein
VSSRYLLPCPCGENIPVEAAQAGQIVRCSCGKEIEVPTLLKLRSLETISEEPRTAVREGWGMSQGLTIIGAAIMLAAAASLVFFYVYRPVPPEAVFTEELVERDFRNLTLLNSEAIWGQLRLGLNNARPIDPTYRQALKTYWVSKYATVGEAYQGAVMQYRIRLGVAIVVFVLAVGAIILGSVMARAKAREDLFEEPIISSP